MAHKLRPYQTDCLNALYGYFEQSKGSPVAVIPTGGGKSLVISEWIMGICKEYPDTNFLVLSHVAKLLSQNAEELAGLWPTAPISFYSAGLGQKKFRQIHQCLCS